MRWILLPFWGPIWLLAILVYLPVRFIGETFERGFEFAHYKCNGLTWKEAWSQAMDGH